MANFESCVKWVLGNEDGLVDHPRDPGGITNFGISFRFLKSLPVQALKGYGFGEELTQDDVMNMSEEQAVAVYKGEFWDNAPFEKIQNGILAKYIFDMAVLHGIGNGVRIAQRATWAANKKVRYVVDDGVLGPKTIQAINQTSFMLLPPMMAERACFCRAIGRPEFIEGWLNRCYRI